MCLCVTRLQERQEESNWRIVNYGMSNKGLLKSNAASSHNNTFVMHDRKLLVGVISKKQ